MLLPLPLSPTRPIISPGSTAISTDDTASTMPPGVWKRTVSPYRPSRDGVAGTGAKGDGPDGDALACKMDRPHGIFVDADGATQPPAFDELVKKIGDAGCIIASRWIPGAIVSPKQPLKRRIASRIFNWLVKTLFGVKIHDTQCGAKLCQGSAVKKVLPLLGLTRWAFDVDWLFQLHRCGYSIIETPTVWQDVGGSQLQVGKASTEMFIAIVRLRLLHSPFKFIVTIYDRPIGRFVHEQP